MKQQIIKIHDAKSLDIASARIRYHMGQGEKVEVVIRDQRNDYSAAQRQTYWMWVGEICKFTGDDDDDKHLDLKKRFLVPIYRRDDPDYEEMMQAVIASGSAKLGRGVIGLTSITDASRSQMNEFMDRVQRHAAQDMGLVLTVPESLR